MEEKRIELGRLRLEGVFEGCEITSFSMRISPGEHAFARITGRLGLSEAKEWMYKNLDKRTAAVKQEGDVLPLFSGLIGRTAMNIRGGMCELELELVSGSTLLDLKRESRSYQDGAMTYRQIMKETVGEVEGGAIIFSQIGEETTNQPLIRYLETSWEFLSRLASHKGVPLVPDINTTGAPRIFAGIPQIQKSPIVWEDWEIIKTYQDGRFLQLGGLEAGLAPVHFLRYDVKGYENLRVGQKVFVKGRELRIVGVEADSIQGELVFLYHAALEKFCYIPKQYQEKLRGLCLLGTVIDRAGEDVRLHLDIDEGRQSADCWLWPWTPPTGNFMYLMPKVGSRVSLYFSNGDERSGKGINCIGGAGGNPKDRWLKTEHGKNLNLTQKELSLTSGSGGNSIQMGGSAVNFSGRSIYISANDIKLSGNNIEIKCKGDIKAGCGSYVPSGTGMEFATTAYLELSGEEVEVCGDSKTEIKTKSSGMAYPAYPDAPEEGKYNLGKSAAQATAAVAVVGGSVVLVCVTAGASTPVIVGAASTAVLAGVGTVATDYMRGSVGEFEDYVNAVANAELMFLTNMAATKVIQVAGLGYGAGVALREGSMAAVGAMQQLATDGELDYGELAMNLVINTIVDVGIDAVTGSIPGGGGRSKRGSGALEGWRDDASGVDFFYKLRNTDDITYENILRELRQSDTPEGYAVAAMLKRGTITLEIQNAHPQGWGGLFNYGKKGNTNIVIFKSAMKSPLDAAGYAGHEAKHYLQKLTPSTYSQFHEFEAFTWQRKINKGFILRDNEEVWRAIKSHPQYRNLREYPY